MKTILAISTLLTASAWGQVGGPTPGYVFDEAAQEFRPMRGMAGSAHLGSALLKEVTAASASVDGTLAVAARYGGIDLIRGFDTASPLSETLTQEPGPVLISWSGHDLAIVFVTTRKAMVWRNADAKSDATAPFDISSIDGEIVAAVFDGTRLALASRGGLYVARDGETKRIAELDSPSGLILSDDKLFVADRGKNQILRVTDFAGQATVDTFAEVADPVGMQMSKKRLLVASASQHSIEAFDAASGMLIAALELDFLPTRLESLGSRPLALLNKGSVDEPLYVLDSGDTLQVYFVPAGREQ